MSWYKIVVNGTIIAVGTVSDLRRVQEKHHVLVISDENNAQYIQSEETLYRDTWFAPVTSRLYAYTEAQIYSITEEEYTDLKEEIDEGNEPEQPDEPEEEEEQPEEEAAEPATRTRLQVLEEQVAAMQEENAMLTECLLEMSELVYG